jgi:tRNA G18 (ribose-2'-O)-methylase SpoU
MPNFKTKVIKFMPSNRWRTAFRFPIIYPAAGEKVAVVFGNEVKGVQQKVVNICDGSIEIPQFGTKHSFNVSVSAGIVLWDIFRKLQTQIRLISSRN